MLRGEVDLDGAPKLREAIDASGGPLRIDMSEVIFLDSSGLNCIARAVAAQRDVTLLSPTRPVRRVLEITHVDELVTIID